MQGRKVATTVALCAAVLTPGVAAAHGTDRPGPQGGEVRMPGAFHVEAVASGDVLSLYLLDVRIENPATADSWVRPEIHQDGEAIELSCEVEGKGFRCPLPKRATLGHGRLVVTAQRADMPSAQASYELPLRPGGAQDASR